MKSLAARSSPLDASAEGAQSREAGKGGSRGSGRPGGARTPAAAAAWLLVGPQNRERAEAGVLISVTSRGTTTAWGAARRTGSVSTPGGHAQRRGQQEGLPRTHEQGPGVHGAPGTAGHGAPRGKPRPP